MRFRSFFQCFLSTGLVLLLGCGTPSFVVTLVSNANELDENTVAPGKGLFPDKIAIVEVEGTLANAKSSNLLETTENPVSLFTQELDMAADDSRVKAVVLRVNSPGGTVSGSDAMYQMLLRFKAKTHKPVVASIQEVGASGAYYVSCGADKIMAQPTSLVGSIGVIFETFNLEGTMNKLGVRAENYKSAAHKDIGSPFREPTDDEKLIMQQLVDDYYARFKSIVLTNRPITNRADFPMITDGRSSAVKKPSNWAWWIRPVCWRMRSKWPGICRIPRRRGGRLQTSHRFQRIDLCVKLSTKPEIKRITPGFAGSFLDVTDGILLYLGTVRWKLIVSS